MSREFVRSVSVQLLEPDDRALRALQEDLGLTQVTEVLRFALRELARNRGLLPSQARLAVREEPVRRAPTAAGRAPR